MISFKRGQWLFSRGSFKWVRNPLLGEHAVSIHRRSQRFWRRTHSCGRTLARRDKKQEKRTVEPYWSLVLCSNAERGWGRPISYIAYPHDFTNIKKTGLAAPAHKKMRVYWRVGLGYRPNDFNNLLGVIMHIDLISVKLE